jgi:hypothetical protein
MQYGFFLSFLWASFTSETSGSYGKDYGYLSLLGCEEVKFNGNVKDFGVTCCLHI